jgi:fused signal recognition particle receptor
LKTVFSKLYKGLTKTRTGLVEGITRTIGKRTRFDQDTLDELEELLILSDVGVETAEHLIEELETRSQKKEIQTTEDVLNLLKSHLVAVFDDVDTGPSNKDTNGTPRVISVVGVNGTGKTTTIGKLAHRFQQEGSSVILAAADTFRAAAIDQLEIWASRAGVELVRHIQGSDPAAVAFDALKAAKSRSKDILIIDTAGRLHTKSNLMQELTKIHRILEREHPGAPHEVLLVIDATTGQNGLIQARQFARDAGVTGIVLTKLDGTAKGGIVFSIAKELNLPVRYVGVGEQLDDLQPFSPKEFVEALLS